MSYTNNSQQVLRQMADAKKGALRMIGIKAVSNCVKYTTLYGAVDTGQLRNSWDSEVRGDKTAIGSALDYALYVEVGTSRMTGRPILKDAIMNHKEEYEAIAKALMTR